MNPIVPLIRDNFVLLAAGLGLLIGSFLNVVIFRLPRMLERDWAEQLAQSEGRPPSAKPAYNLVVPRSCCPHCQHHIRAWHNIPVLSFVWLRGRCPDCGARISWRYPLIEALSGLLSAWLAQRLGFGAAGIGALILLWFLIALTFIDIDTFLLPDTLTLPLLWIGLLFNVSGTFAPLQEAVIGAVAGYLVLWLVYWAFRLATQKEGMGYGDFKLLAALGAWLGWPLLVPVILLSSVCGAVIGITLLVLRRHTKEAPLPFGPYLAIAGLITFAFHQPILALLGWR